MNLDFKILNDARNGDRIVLKCQWAQGQEFSYSRDYSSRTVAEIPAEITQAHNDAQAKAADLHARYTAAQNA